MQQGLLYEGEDELDGMDDEDEEMLVDAEVMEFEVRAHFCCLLVWRRRSMAWMFTKSNVCVTRTEPAGQGRLPAGGGGGGARRGVGLRVGRRVGG